MRSPDFDIQKVIDFLQGTLNSISDAFGEGGILDDDFKPIYLDMTEDDILISELETLDMQIFQCETCGWWCEISFMGMQDRICQDCCDEEDE